MTGAEVAVAAALAPEIIGATAAGTAAATGATAAGLGAAGTAAGLGAADLVAGGTAAGFGAGLLAPEAAAAGAGAGMGGGLTSMFGGALAPEMVAAPTAVTGAGLAPAPTVAAPMAGMGGGTASLFGPSVAPASASSGLPWAKMAGQMGKGMVGQDQQQATHAQRPPQGQSPQMSNQEILQRLKMAQAGRSNFAGLLGRFQ